MFSEKVQKETVTDNLIKQDILYLMKADNYTIKFDAFMCGVVLIPITAVMSIITPYVWFLLLIPAAIFAIIFAVRYRWMRNIKSGEFTVITDKLVHEEWEASRRLSLKPAGTPTVTVMDFFNCGRWELDGDYYRWSKLYSMSGSGVFNRSHVGDEFILVLYNNNDKILIGYNTKFFDYQKQ